MSGGDNENVAEMDTVVTMPASQHGKGTSFLRDYFHSYEFFFILNTTHRPARFGVVLIWVARIWIIKTRPEDDVSSSSSLRASRNVTIVLEVYI
jgi:hypothetical protein